MLDFTKISDNLIGIVGFKQPYNPDYAIIDTDNQSSTSGLFVTSNEFCKIEYLYDSQDYAGISDSDFNEYLVNKQKDSIVNVVKSVFDEADFRERSILYPYALNRAELTSMPVGFVGYRLVSGSNQNVSIVINRVICEFDGTGDFTILCFSSSQKEPLFTKNVTITTDNQSVELNWNLNNTDVYKGEYFIGYINNSLSITPFKRNYNNSNIRNTYKDVCIYPVSCDSTSVSEIFDLTSLDGLSEYCGLNLDIATFDDFTDLVINNKQMFAMAILLDLQISCLSTYLSSLRSNLNDRNANNLVSKVIAEIEGQEGEGIAKYTGLRPQLFRSISKIKKEIKKLKDGVFGDGLMVDTLC